MRLAVIDDHPLILTAMASVVGTLPDYSCRGFIELVDFDDAVAAGGMFELVLLDLRFPKREGLRALEYFREWYDDIPVVILSGDDNSETIRSCLALGAMGYIPKNRPPEEIATAIRLVAKGVVYVPTEALSPPTPNERGGPGSALDVVKSDEEIARELTALTPRQRDVMSLLLRGMPNKLICRNLGLAPDTVKSHVSSILRAFNVENRTQAVIAARKQKVSVDLRPPQQLR